MVVALGEGPSLDLGGVLAVGGQDRPKVLLQVGGRADHGGPTSLGGRGVWDPPGVVGAHVHAPTFPVEGVSHPSDCVGGAPLVGPSPTGHVISVAAVPPTGHVTQEGVSARLPTALVGVQEVVLGGPCPSSPPTDRVTWPAAVVGVRGEAQGVSCPSPPPTAARASPAGGRGEVQEGVPARSQTPTDHRADVLHPTSAPHVGGPPCHVTPHDPAGAWTGGCNRTPPCWSRPGGLRSRQRPPSPRWWGRATGGCSRMTLSRRQQRPDCRAEEEEDDVCSGLAAREWGADHHQTQHFHLNKVKTVFPHSLPLSSFPLSLSLSLPPSLFPPSSLTSVSLVPALFL